MSRLDETNDAYEETEDLDLGTDSSVNDEANDVSSGNEPTNDPTKDASNGYTSISTDIVSADWKVDPAASCYAEFSDGYSFRNLVEYLRLTNFEGVFRFYPDRIVYEESNEDKTVLNHAAIQTFELTDYSFSSRTGEIIICVNLVKFRNVTKNVGKKDRVSLLKTPDDTNLYVQVFNTNSQSSGEQSGLYVVPTQPAGYTEYKHPNYDKPPTKPNCTIYQADFSKMCSSMISVKSSYVTGHGLERGIIFKGMTASGTPGCIRDFGKVREDHEKKIQNKVRTINFNLPSLSDASIRIKASDKPTPKLKIGEYGEIENISIAMSTIKGLAKLNNLSPMGTIKVYAEKGRPLKLICSIGGYGTLTVYLRSYE